MQPTSHIRIASTRAGVRGMRKSGTQASSGATNCDRGNLLFVGLKAIIWLTREAHHHHRRGYFVSELTRLALQRYCITTATRQANRFADSNELIDEHGDAPLFHLISSHPQGVVVLKFFFTQSSS